MQEYSSTWVSRHWAATAGAANVSPVVVNNHRRKRVVIMGEALAADFLAWYVTQEHDPDPLRTEAEALAREQQAAADARAVRVLQAKFKLHLPRKWTAAHLAIVVGDMPDTREELEAVMAEYAEVEEPWWLDD
jgi:hypothetical protein